MALSTPDHYDSLALAELEAAAAVSDPEHKKRRLNQAAAFATLAEISREKAAESISREPEGSDLSRKAISTNPASGTRVVVGDV